MTDTAVSAESLSAGYSGKAVINNINITVEKGSILTLIGPNGAGKSTVLKTICRQLSPVSGKVFIGSQELRSFNSRELAKKMSVLLTQKVNSPLMTCREAVETGRYPYTGTMGVLSPEDRRKVDEALEMAGVSDLADRDIDKLSDGQRQRVLLARAICQEAGILILDEPATFLDIRYKLELMKLLKELAEKRGTCIIMSLHELELAQKVSDKVLCIKKGLPDRYGVPEDIFSSGYIETLYSTEKGRYCPLYGSLELSPADGSPEIFVIGGNGEGINVYRRLQRKGIPFAAGIIHTNDTDFPVAQALASKVICETPFEEISELNYHEAVDIMDKCRNVICAVSKFGTMNKRNKDLALKAEQDGKLVSDMI